MAHAIGLSVGAAKLAGVAVGSAAVVRSAVLTRFAHRPPEVGLPSENPELDERGLIIKDFVDRVGDPVPIVASDGSSHGAATLLTEALCSLLYAVNRGRAPTDPIGVTYPVHWRQPAVDALRRALAAVPEFREPRPVALVADAVAALTALQDDPGVPTSGIIAVCDFGATGTSITLADAARAFEPIAPTVRDTDLSGDVVDQVLLTRVIADLAAAGSIDLSDTSAIGSLTRLRGQCRVAKERLSTSAVTTLAVDLPGRSAEVRVTRDELEESIDRPLASFVEVLYEELRRNGIRQNDLVAVASVGGGARIPVVTTTLSEYLRVPVVTNGHPELSAAIGAGLKGLHASVDDGVTSMAVSAARPAHAPTSGSRALARADADDVAGPRGPKEEGRIASSRPLIEFDDEDIDPEVIDDEQPSPWYRNPFALLAAGVGVVLAATVAAAIIVLVRDDTPAPASTSVQTSRAPTTTPPPPEPSPEPAPEQLPPPDESTAAIPSPAPAPLETDDAPVPRASTPSVQPAPSVATTAAEVPPPAPPSEAAPAPPPSETAPAPPVIPAVPEVPPIPAIP